MGSCVTHLPLASSYKGECVRSTTAQRLLQHGTKCQQLSQYTSVSIYISIWNIYSSTSALKRASIIFHHSCFNVVVSTLYDDTLEQAESQERTHPFFFYLSNYHLQSWRTYSLFCLISALWIKDDASLVLYYVDVRLHSMTSLAEFRKLVRRQYIISYLCSRLYIVLMYYVFPVTA